MPGTNYTTNLRLANPSLNDTGWGTTVSSGMIDLTDQAIAGLATADVTFGNVTLTIVDGSAGTNSARNMFLNITGTPGVARDVIVPTNRKLYFVTNNCGQIATVKVSGQPGVAVPAGASMTLRINAAGTDVAPTFTYAASMSLGTALPATSGGTGQSSFAVGDLLYANTTTTLAKLADVATGNVLRSGGVGVAPAWGKVDLTADVTGTLPVANGGTGGTLPVANGGTGQTTANAALNALLPSQTSNNNKFLQTDGTNTSWATVDILGTIAAASAGAVGTYALMIPAVTTSFAVGDQTAGSNLRFGGTYTDGSGNTGPVIGSAPSGNWRAMGPTNGGYSFTITLWLRYA